MAVPPDQMGAMLGAGTPGAPGATPDTLPGNSPQAAPMATPEPPAGLREAAKVDVMLAVKVLERALPAFGFDTTEGKAILDTLKKFSKVFGASEASTQELMPAEIQTLLQQLPQGAGGGPGAAPAPAAAPAPGGVMPPGAPPAA